MRRPGVGAALAAACALATVAACSTAAAEPAPTAPSASPTAVAEPELPSTPASPSSTPSATPSPTPTGPVFASSVSTITPELAERMRASWRPGCPVPLEDLRYVTVSHVDLTGAERTGELVVHADVADAVVVVFATLFDARFPVASMRLVDDFGADDTTSMEADNTSAFNCRAITGGTAWSEHAYGRAIDLNPVENPYVVGAHVAPADGRAFVDRPDLPGVVHDGDVVVQAFAAAAAAAGWGWGGHWDSPLDYQHFSRTGR